MSLLAIPKGVVVKATAPGRIATGSMRKKQYPRLHEVCRQYAAVEVFFSELYEVVQEKLLDSIKERARHIIHTSVDEFRTRLVETRDGDGDGGDFPVYPVSISEDEHSLSATFYELRAQFGDKPFSNALSLLEKEGTCGGEVEPSEVGVEASLDALKERIASCREDLEAVRTLTLDFLEKLQSRVFPDFKQASRLDGGRPRDYEVQSRMVRAIKRLKEHDTCQSAFFSDLYDPAVQFMRRHLRERLGVELRLFLNTCSTFSEKDWDYPDAEHVLYEEKDPHLVKFFVCSSSHAYQFLSWIERQRRLDVLDEWSD